MLTILNKIDPVIVNNVHQQTAEGVVHAYEKTRVSKDGKRDREKQPSHKDKKDKISKFNSMLKAMGLDMSFKLEGDLVVMVDKEGNIINTYTDDQIEKLLQKMEDMMGVIVDTKR